MSLFRKIVGDKSGPASGHAPSEFHSSERSNLEEPGSKNAPRRDLVHVVLRDTMRRHGIPSDWIDCRILSAMSRTAVKGMHVTFVVRGGQERMLAFVPSFQGSFMRALQQFEPRASDWLFSLSWQFDGLSESAGRPLTETAGWNAAAVPAAAAGVAAAAAAAPAAPDADMAADLEALFAIRDAALRPPDLDLS